ncbi:hypothetical protein R1flu_004615 [Riccia fluitans]|uniref:Cytochrome P450 n=1 Tax=Riccia fluitans TaxID=41844 RepID=A0ABD1YQT7_9MARC
MMNFKEGVKLSLGALIGVAVVVHGTKLALQIAAKWPKKPLPPGPRPRPVFGNVLQLGPSPCRMLAKVCEQYGGVMSFWVGSHPTVILTSAQIVVELFSRKRAPDTFESRPGMLIHGGVLTMGEARGYRRYMNVSTHKSLQWRKLRRILSTYLIHTNRTTKFHPLRESNRDHVLAVILENLKKEASASKCFVLNSRKHLRPGILNLLFTTCFGSVVDLTTGLMDHQLLRLLTAFKEVVKLGVTSRFSDYLPILPEVPATIADIELAESAKRAEECCVQTVGVIRKRFHPKDPKKSHLLHSFLDVLCNLRGDEKLNDREITWILSEILLTATDNTSTLVEWALGQLIYRPDLQAMIQAEIDRVIGGNKTISENDIEQMPYLKAMVKETLRVNHPVMLTLPHVTTKPLEVCDGMYLLPSGTTVIAHIPALYTDPNVWDNPYEFRPERYFSDMDEEREEPERLQLQSDIFSAVRRFSPGQGLVLLKAQILIAKILQSFDLLPAFDGRPKPFDETSSSEFGVINQMKLPLDISFRPRSTIF